MSNIEQHQASGWNVAAIAAETNTEVALEIINRMELVEESCDSSDWESLAQYFGGVDKLKEAIYTFDNAVGA